MSEWITDRRPTEDDGKYVYSFYGNVCLWSEFRDGEPWKPIPKCEPYVWKPIPKCEPYVKPKRFRVEYFEYDEEKESGRFSPGCYIMVTDFIDDDIIYHKTPLPYLTNRDTHKEAAERIAAIYEEVMP